MKESFVFHLLRELASSHTPESRTLFSCLPAYGWVPRSLEYRQQCYRACQPQKPFPGFLCKGPKGVLTSPKLNFWLAWSSKWGRDQGIFLLRANSWQRTTNPWSFCTTRSFWKAILFIPSDCNRLELGLSHRWGRPRNPRAAEQTLRAALWAPERERIRQVHGMLLQGWRTDFPNTCPPWGYHSSVSSADRCFRQIPFSSTFPG